MDYLYAHSSYRLARKEQAYQALCRQLDVLDKRREEIVAQARASKRTGTGKVFYLKSAETQSIHRIDGLKRFCHIEGVGPLSIKGILKGTFVHPRWTLPTQDEVDLATTSGTLDKTHSA